MPSDTPSRSAGDDEDKLYKIRARAALPILVRQAHAGATIYYEDLARELSMPNILNLNDVLRHIGWMLGELGTQWNEEIPRIQTLVINQKHQTPGDGIEGFLPDVPNFSTLSRREKREVFFPIHREVFRYVKWRDVLLDFGLPEAPLNLRALVNAASEFRGGGESENHSTLKDWIATHPEVFGLPASVAHGVTEYELPSGDRLDVLFTHRGEYVAVEAKSAISGEADITRGVFQCVKYRAVLAALLVSQGKPPDVRVILAMEGHLSPQNMVLKNILGIEVYERVTLP